MIFMPFCSTNSPPKKAATINLQREKWEHFLQTSINAFYTSCFIQTSVKKLERSALQAHMTKESIKYLLWKLV